MARSRTDLMKTDMGTANQTKDAVGAVYLAIRQLLLSKVTQSGFRYKSLRRRYQQCLAAVASTEYLFFWMTFMCLHVHAKNDC